MQFRNKIYPAHILFKTEFSPLLSIDKECKNMHFTALVPLYIRWKWDLALLMIDHLRKFNPSCFYLTPRPLRRKWNKTKVGNEDYRISLCLNDFKVYANIETSCQGTIFCYAIILRKQWKFLLPPKTVQFNRNKIRKM